VIFPSVALRSRLRSKKLLPIKIIVNPKKIQKIRITFLALCELSLTMSRIFLQIKNKLSKIKASGSLYFVFEIVS
jgi:hypothetical protein